VNTSRRLSTHIDGPAGSGRQRARDHSNGGEANLPVGHFAERPDTLRTLWTGIHRDCRPRTLRPLHLLHVLHQDALRGDLHAMLNDSDPKRVKGVLQAMIDGIRVDARDQIDPTFRVPAVRIESGYMELVGIEPTTSTVPPWRSPS
jgi:hypothetical protein